MLLSDEVVFSAKSHKDVLLAVEDWMASPSFPESLRGKVKDKAARSAPNNVRSLCFTTAPQCSFQRSCPFLETTSRNDAFCELASCFTSPAHQKRLTLDDFRDCVDGKSTGAVRVSLGIASDFKDAWAFAEFARGLVDR